MAKEVEGTNTSTGTAAPPPNPGGIGGIDTEASDLALMGRLIRENNADETDDDSGSGDEGGDNGSEAAAADKGAGGKDGETKKAASEKGVEGGGGEGEEGEGDGDGGSESGTDPNQALVELAEHLGYDAENLSEAESAMLKKILALSAEGTGEDGGDSDFVDVLTEYEKEEDEEEKKDEQKPPPAGKKKAAAEEEQPLVNDESEADPDADSKFYDAVLAGRLNRPYKSDADFYAKVAKAQEDGDMDAFEVLQNHRFLERGMGLLRPVLERMVNKKLEVMTRLIEPALRGYTSISSQSNLQSSRENAISALEGAKDDKGNAPYSHIRKFLTPDKPDEKVVIDGRSYPSSPYTRIAKKHPEAILQIRVDGKDGKIDRTRTFIAQYKAAIKLDRLERQSSSSPSTKKAAAELVNAGIKAGERQSKKNKAGTLNSNSSSGGNNGKQGGQIDWKKEYLKPESRGGNDPASWILGG